MLAYIARSAVEAAVQKGRTVLVMVESPTNPRMQARRYPRSRHETDDLLL